jgi:hypothetical protein
MSATATIEQFNRPRALAELRTLGIRLHGQATAHASGPELDDTLKQLQAVHDDLTIDLAYAISQRLGRSIQSIAVRRAAATDIIMQATAAA